MDYYELDAHKHAVNFDRCHNPDLVCRKLTHIKSFLLNQRANSVARTKRS